MSEPNQPAVVLSLDEILALVSGKVAGALEPKVLALDAVSSQLETLATGLEAKLGDMVNNAIAAGVATTLEKLEQLGMMQLAGPAAAPPEPPSSRTQDARPVAPVQPDAVIPRRGGAATAPVPATSPLARMSIRKVDGATGRTMS